MENGGTGDIQVFYDGQYDIGNISPTFQAWFTLIFQYFVLDLVWLIITQEVLLTKFSVNIWGIWKLKDFKRKKALCWFNTVFPQAQMFFKVFDSMLKQKSDI